VSDENWDKGPERPLADIGFSEEGDAPALMHEVYISDHIRSTSQRFIYVYDFLHMWMFMVELIQAGDPAPGTSYPRVVLSMNEAPGEHSREDDLTAGIMEDDPYALDAEEQQYEEDDEHGFDGEDDHNEFGHGSGDEHGDEFR
jgi:hypothetical protein